MLDAYVFEHGFHECNGNFCLLDEVILRILDFESGVFLSLRACILEPGKD